MANETFETDIQSKSAACEALSSLNMSHLYRAATRVLQNAQDSEDALQDAMLSAFVHFDQFQGRSQLSTWVHSIVSNAARQQLRRRRVMTPIADDTVDNEVEATHSDCEVLTDSHRNPEEEYVLREESEIFSERLKGLPPDYRSVVQACIVEGLMRKEAAQKLGISIATVKTRLHRARVLLIKQTWK